MQGETEFVQITTDSHQAVREIAKLFSVSEADLKQVLSERAVAARGDVVMKGHTMELAIYARDAFAKVIFGLVLYLYVCCFGYY